MLLYILRHGDPDYANDCLTSKGKLQAQALAKRLAVHGLDKIYTSPLGRAIQTAEPTCDLLKIKYKIEPWTSEDIALSRFSAMLPNGKVSWIFGQQNTLIKNDDTVNLGSNWHKAKALEGADCKKGYQDLISESDHFLNKLGYKRKGSIYEIIRPSSDRVAVFCHQGFGLTWMSHLLQIPPHLFWTGFDITHSSISIFEFKNNEDNKTAPKCLCLSDTSHLYHDALPLKYNNLTNI